MKAGVDGKEQLGVLVVCRSEKADPEHQVLFDRQHPEAP